MAQDGAPGGIVGLGPLLREHRSGVEADLESHLGIGLEAVPGTIGWDGLYSFASGMGENSATFASLHPEYAPWTTKLKLAQVLTDLYDLIAVFRYDYLRAHGSRSAQKPKPYPRPWCEQAGVKHFGRGAIPIRDFDSWYYGDSESETTE